MTEKWWMNKEEVIHWLSAYNENPDYKKDRRTEEEVGVRVRNQRKLSKDDLLRMVHWKFNFNRSREKWMVRHASRNSPEDIESKFSKAVGTSDDLKRYSILDGLHGVGPAMVSVILAFYDPKNYGVFDIHAWRELHCQKKEPHGLYLFEGPTHLSEFETEIRQIAQMHSLDAREVEKALFERNYTRGSVDSKVGVASGWCVVG